MTDDCNKCDGSGYLPLEKGDQKWEELKDRYGEAASLYLNTTSKRCICRKRELFREQVGEDIYQAEKLDESPLETYVDENLFITASRETLLPHIRYVLKEQGLDFRWSRTTDAELRDVYLGNLEDVTSLSQIVEGPDLLFIYLAVLSYENCAMSGILMESLKARQYDEGSTWIVTPPTHPFREGHEAYSEELDRFIDRRFTRISFEKDGVEEGTYDQEASEDDVNDIANDLI